MSTVLVSGATGYLGRAFVGAVDSSVVALVRGRDPHRIGQLCNAQGKPVAFVGGDVRAPMWGLSDEDFDRMEGSVTSVVNMAAITRWSAPWEQLEQTNVLGARHAAEVAARLGVPLIHVSSLYAAYSLNGVVSEELVPESEYLTRYERSKNRAEWMVAEAVERFDLPATIVRIGGLGGDIVGATRRSGAPLLRLFEASRINVMLIAQDATIDLVPRDLAAAALARAVAHSTRPTSLVRHVSLGHAAPGVVALVAEMRRIQRSACIKPFRVVSLSPRQLLNLSLAADRFGTSVSATMAIGVRYLASSAQYRTTESFSSRLTFTEYLTSLGYGHARFTFEQGRSDIPFDPYYEQWPAGF